MGASVRTGSPSTKQDSQVLAVDLLGDCQRFDDGQDADCDREITTDECTRRGSSCAANLVTVTTSNETARSCCGFPHSGEEFLRTCEPMRLIFGVVKLANIAV